MCNIRKNCYHRILTGSILQDILAGQEIAGFMKFQAARYVCRNCPLGILHQLRPCQHTGT